MSFHNYTGKCKPIILTHLAYIDPHLANEYRIENFVYTMVKFQLSGCAVMICVSDPLCMQKCSEAHFPCIDFNYTKFHPVSRKSVLKQINFVS